MAESRKQRRRTPLTGDRIMRAAVELADEGGLEALSMRRLGADLKVVPMALYKHVENKEDLLDGMVELVFAEIEDPSTEIDWKDAMRRRGISARAALKRHPWAIGLLESRMTPGPANLAHHNAVLRCLREAGFAPALATHAYSVQDAYVYGFALQEQTLPFETPEEHSEIVERKAAAVGDLSEYPHLVEMATGVGQAGFDFAAEFEWGLDLVLDGLERVREAGEG